MPPGRSLQLSRRTALYRLFDHNDQLLYVGIAFDPHVRCYHHKTHKPWWPEVARREVEWHDNRRAAEAAELAAIAAEKPRYNISGVPDPMRIPAPPLAPKPRPSGVLAESLKKAARAQRRAAAARERHRESLAELFQKARDEENLGPADLARLVNYLYTPDHISRITKPPKKKS